MDYNEIFSPVVKHTSIRLLLSMAAHYDMEVEQMDVRTAFLHGELEENIFMQQPRGYEVKGKEDWVCKLKKSLYGLKQFPGSGTKSLIVLCLARSLKGATLIVVCTLEKLKMVIMCTCCCM